MCFCVCVLTLLCQLKRKRDIFNSHCCKEELIQTVYPNLGPHQDLDCQTSTSRHPVRYRGQGLLSQNEMGGKNQSLKWDINRKEEESDPTWGELTTKASPEGLLSYFPPNLSGNPSLCNSFLLFPFSVIPFKVFPPSTLLGKQFMYICTAGDALGWKKG